MSENASAATDSKVVAKATATAPATAPAAPKLGVKYMGGAGVRRITRQDFASLGIENEAVEFNRINGYVLPATEFSAEALNYAEHVDPNLLIVEI